MAQQWLSASDPFFSQFSGYADESGYQPGPYDPIVAGLSRPDNWATVASQLGFTGQMTAPTVNASGDVVESWSPEFLNFIEQKRAEGYDFVTDASKIDKSNQLVGLRLPSGEVVNQTPVKAAGFGEFFKEFVLPSIGAYFGAGALGNALSPVTNALTGIGGAGAGAGAGGALTGMELAGGSADLIPGVMGGGQFSAAGGLGNALTAADLTNLPTDILGSGGDVTVADLASAGAEAAPSGLSAADRTALLSDTGYGAGMTGAQTGAYDAVIGATGSPSLANIASNVAGTVNPLVDRALSLINTPAGQAVLGAAGSAVSGIMEAGAAQEAAQTQAQAAQNALALQREMFEYQKGLLEPYRTAGTKALERLSGAMGLGGPGSQQQMLEMDPGYGFRLGEGLKALERMQASRGNFLSGGALKAGQRFAQDTASQEYGNAYNRLANIAGLGQTVGGQLGNAAAGFGTSAGNIMGQEANALAAGRAARGSAYSNAIGGALGSYQNYLNRQQEERLIRDIFGRTTVGG